MVGRASRACIVIACVVALLLPGCSSEKPVGSVLTLDHLSSSSPPHYYVNVSAADLDHFAPLGKLVKRWERENMNGTFSGFNIPLPYEEGLSIVRTLQDREPQGYWRAGSVAILYDGNFFDLTAFPDPHGD